MKLNWLIITDHTRHEKSNSLYALTNAIREDDRCGEMWVCSRGQPANADFFSGRMESKVVAAAIGSRFTFENADALLEKTDGAFHPSTVDVVLFRMPQPVERPFITRIRSYFPHAQFINAPEGIIETASKEFLLQVRELCPTLSLCESLAEAIALSHQYEIVLKPMYSYGGRGMFRLSPDTVWKEDEHFPISQVHDIIKAVDFPMLSMRFLKNVVLGDKRTIVVNREVIGAALRLPAPGSWMCNIAHGGRAQLDEPDADEWRIESVLTPMLLKKGIVMYGFDTLVDDAGRRVLSEINTLSIGGLMPMEEMSKKPVLKRVVDALYAYVRS